MNRREMNNLYLQWIRHLVCDNVYRWKQSYRKLFSLLHNTEFIYRMDMDANRADDGIDLRYRFAYEMHLEDDDVYEFLDNRPCSVLEMMVALASRCEEIMDNPDKGDRTGKWFYNMLDSLDLLDMDDRDFDQSVVTDILERFMRRDFDYNGHGGLFALSYPKEDMRDVEIWYQMMAYLEENVDSY